MATTRKTTRKARRAGMVKKPTNKTKVESGKRYLSHEDLLFLERTSLEIENLRLKKNVEEQYLLNLNIKLDALKLTIQSQQGVLARADQQYQNKKSQFEKNKKLVWEKYGFAETDALGYNDTSGELITN